ncbi:Planctomycete cytochrome C [Spirosomataceae bacterium TFI 002]|nr:Planctomycete cytochrome C [Spirosomataceae bacterium TFI 002]
MISRNTIQLLLVVGLLYSIHLSCSDGSAQGATSPDVVDYNLHIRPILSDNCFTCHGPDANKRKANLRLDIAEEAFKALSETPGAHAIVPKKPLQSEVYKRLITENQKELMPPPASNLKLTENEINLIEKWIKQGAVYKPHWAFIAPEKSKLPRVDDEDWTKNEIDFFVLNKQEQNNLKHQAEGDKESLLKRVSYDITGLPPSLELMDSFLADESEDAYEKVVDKLLSLPSYGEKMAVYWMDISRFADSHGYQDDSYRSQWPWRDWVIHQFNQNTPYDKFVTLQLAGDLMPEASKEQILATAFNRNHKITEEGGIIDEEYRVSYVSDRTNTFSKAFLGMTMECASCHDHKYDPTSQKDYYQLFSFFNNIEERGRESVVGGPETYAKVPYMKITNGEVDSLLTFINKRDTSQLIVSIMGELPDSTRPTFVLNRGNYDQHGEEVTPVTPDFILPFEKTLPKNRLGLSKWLFDKKNPLTARVFVNQVWQEYFGVGLVKTTGDFGMQGSLPSHPELLDWLAVDFMEQNWDVKKLIRKMVTSATYRQSANIDDKSLTLDPENKWLTRAPRARLKAEFIRDLLLTSSGLLTDVIGGPSIKPYQPEGLWEGASSGRGILSMYKQDHGDDLYRRGLYCFIKRTVPPPSMTIFDGSNRDQCEVARMNTNTPLQALVLLNDPTVLEASRVFAAKLLKEKSSPKDKIYKAFRTIVCRKPSDKEVEILDIYVAKKKSKLDLKTASELLNVGEYPLEKNIDKIELAALMQAITILYNMEETLIKT